MIELSVSLLWEIWKMRHKWCFNNFDISAIEVVDKVIKEWNEFQECRLREQKEQNWQNRQAETQVLGN